MEFNIKFDEQMVVESANRVLDEFEYNGKTIREWANILTHPKSNADRIRSMSDEELVEIFANNDCGYCRIHDFCFAKGSALNCEDVWLDWLRQEAVSNG